MKEGMEFKFDKAKRQKKHTKENSFEDELRDSLEETW